MNYFEIGSYHEQVEVDLFGIIKVNLFIDDFNLLLDLRLVLFHVHRPSTVSVSTHIASYWDVKVAHIEDCRVDA
jgi:hypothetical protein